MRTQAKNGQERQTPSSAEHRNDRNQGQLTKPGEFEDEQWRSIIGYNYEVSDLGRVRNSLDGRILKPSAPSKKYLYVNLYPRPSLWAAVHRLVAEAFIGPCPEGCEVRHIDDDPVNNSWSNIVYGTRGENNRDRKCNKRWAGHPIIPDDVHIIRARLAAGELQRDIAKDFGVSRTAITSINLRRNHTDV